MKLLAVALLLCSGAFAGTFLLPGGTPLLDGSTFDSGTLYYVALEMTSGGGPYINQATLSNFDLDGGFAWMHGALDPGAGQTDLAPDPFSVDGIGQAGALLQLTVSPANAFALYSQLISAGNSFSFDASISGNYAPGFAPDAFIFQLYDANFTALLYEQGIEIRGAAQAPEPAASALLAVAITWIFWRRDSGLSAPSWRTRGRPSRR